MKIRPLGARLFYEDKWADMTKLIVAFQNFVKRLKKIYVTRALAMFILYTHVFGML